MGRLREIWRRLGAGRPCGLKTRTSAPIASSSRAHSWASRLQGRFRLRLRGVPRRFREKAQCPVLSPGPHRGPTPCLPLWYLAPAEGALAQGAVQDKHARRVRQLGTRGTKVARCLEHVAREPVVASARTGQVKARAVSEPAASAVRVGLKRVAAVESVGRLLSRSAAEASAGGNGSCGRHGHSGACRGWGSPHDRSDGPDEEEERRRGDLSKSARRWFVGELRAVRGRG